MPSAKYLKPFIPFTAIHQTLYPLICIAYWFTYGIDWTTFLLATIFGWAYFNLFTEIVIHRIFAHNTISIKNNILKGLLAIFSMYGVGTAPASFGIMHQKHHVYADTDRDTHSPNHLGFKVLSFFFHRKFEDRDFEGKTGMKFMALSRHLVTDKTIMFVQRISVPLLILPLIAIPYFFDVGVLINWYMWPMAVSVNCLLPPILNHSGWLGGTIPEKQTFTAHARNNFFGNWINPIARNHGTHHSVLWKDKTDEFLIKYLKDRI